MPFSSHVKAAYTVSVDVDHDHLHEVYCSSGFPPLGNYSFFPLPTLYSLKGSHSAHSTLKEWEVVLYLLEGRVAT